MQEIIFILSSIIGIATAAAVRKIPKNKQSVLNVGASSHIKSQINSLIIEKNILTKSITRLYQTDTEFSNIQRTKLLAKYQHQLGIVLTKLEKLDQASRHPDLGPLGDGLITLMDQKLSKLDERLYELSSKISKTNEKSVLSKNDKPPIQKNESKKEKSKPFNFEKPISKTDPKNENHDMGGSFEISTLTNIKKNTQSGFPFVKEVKKHDIIQTVPTIQTSTIQHNTTQPKKQETIKNIKQTEHKIKTNVNNTYSESLITNETKFDVSKEAVKLALQKALPSPTIQQNNNTIDEFAKLEIDIDDGDSDNELDIIKKNISQIMARLDQTEVE